VLDGAARPDQDRDLAARGHAGGVVAAHGAAPPLNGFPARARARRACMCVMHVCVCMCAWLCVCVHLRMSAGSQGRALICMSPSIRTQWPKKTAVSRLLLEQCHRHCLRLQAAVLQALPVATCRSAAMLQSLLAGVCCSVS